MPALAVRTAPFVFALCLLDGQTVDKPLTFDAASVKPALSPANLPGGGDGAAVTKKKSDGVRAGGGPGTSDPGRIHYPNTTLMPLLMKAYDVAFNPQIQGPDWLNTERFAIGATMPPETTQEQFRLMMRNLLVERFKLAVHREAKEFPGYALVLARSGPKLKESAAIPPTPPAPGPRDPYGLAKSSPDPKLAGGRAGVSANMNDRAWRLYCQRQNMHDLASLLPNWANLGSPVADATGLTSQYDFTLTFWPEGSPAPSGDTPPPDIFAALQSQLGLKLEPRKVRMDVIVVDRIEKTPTAN